MIATTLETIAHKLEEFMGLKGDGIGSTIIISDLLDKEGKVRAFEGNPIVMSLINIEEEKATNKVRQPNTYHPMYLNLMVLFSCFYKEQGGEYLDAIKNLSNVFGFFQSHPALTHQNAPELNTGLEKLTFEYVNQDIQTQNYTWSMFGGRYHPSALFKVRMVTIDEGQFGGTTSSFKGFKGGLF